MAEQSLPHQEQPSKILTFITILIYINSFLISQELQENREQYTFERIIFLQNMTSVFLSHWKTFTIYSKVTI